jgi:hypothetical protein
MPVEAAGLTGDASWECNTRIFYDSAGHPYDALVSGCPHSFRRTTVAAAMQWRFAPAPDGNANWYDVRFTYRVGEEPAAPSGSTTLTVRLPGKELVVDVTEGHDPWPDLSTVAVRLPMSELEIRRRQNPDAPARRYLRAVPTTIDADGREVRTVICNYWMAIDEGGRVVEVDSLDCPEGYAEVGTDALEKWRFKPWPSKEEAVVVHTTVKLRWVYIQ